MAQYLNSANNSSYGGAEGVILTRKYVKPTEQNFGSSTQSVDYANSLIKTFLETTYYDNCSNDIKNIISVLNIPCNNTTITAKWFLMSTTEVYNKGNNITEGIGWDYWKEKTGLSSPDAIYSANNGRIVTDREGTPRLTWLRDQYNTNNVFRIGTNGDVYYAYPTWGYGVLPACFISKN